MSAAVAPRLEADPLTRVMAWSIGVHLVVLVIVPVMVRLIWQPRSFERPATFQLVKFSAPTVPRSAPVEKATAKPAEKSKPKPVAAKTPVPKSDKAREKPKQQDENVDELASLLNDMAKPAVEMSSSNGAHNDFYTRNIVNKIDEHWNPPIQKQGIYAEVSFTIFLNGTISDVAIAHSSGDATIDNLAVRAITLAAPFGKIPATYNSDRLDLSYKLYPYKE
jgi:TonB family protein